MSQQPFDKKNRKRSRSSRSTRAHKIVPTASEDGVRAFNIYLAKCQNDSAQEFFMALNAFDKSKLAQACKLSHALCCDFILFKSLYESIAEPPSILQLIGGSAITTRLDGIKRLNCLKQNLFFLLEQTDEVNLAEVIEIVFREFSFSNYLFVKEIDDICFMLLQFAEGKGFFASTENVTKIVNSAVPQFAYSNLSIKTTDFLCQYGAAINYRMLDIVVNRWRAQLQSLKYSNTLFSQVESLVKKITQHKVIVTPSQAEELFLKVLPTDPENSLFLISQLSEQLVSFWGEIEAFLWKKIKESWFHRSNHEQSNTIDYDSPNLLENLQIFLRVNKKIYPSRTVSELWKFLAWHALNIYKPSPFTSLTAISKLDSFLFLLYEKGINLTSPIFPLGQSIIGGREAFDKMKDPVSVQALNEERTAPNLLLISILHRQILSVLSSGDDTREDPIKLEQLAGTYALDDDLADIHGVRVYELFLLYHQSSDQLFHIVKQIHTKELFELELIPKVLNGIVIDYLFPRDRWDLMAFAAVSVLGKLISTHEALGVVNLNQIKEIYSTLVQEYDAYLKEINPKDPYDAKPIKVINTSKFQSTCKNASAHIAQFYNDLGIGELEGFYLKSEQAIKLTNAIKQKVRDGGFPSNIADRFKKRLSLTNPFIQLSRRADLPTQIKACLNGLCLTQGVNSPDFLNFSLRVFDRPQRVCGKNYFAWYKYKTELAMELMRSARVIIKSENPFAADIWLFLKTLSEAIEKQGTPKQLIYFIKSSLCLMPDLFWQCPNNVPLVHFLKKQLAYVIEFEVMKLLDYVDGVELEEEVKPEGTRSPDMARGSPSIAHSTSSFFNERKRGGFEPQSNGLLTKSEDDKPPNPLG